MKEKTSDFVNALNSELTEALTQWKAPTHETEFATALNTIFRLVEKTGLKMVLEVRKDSIFRKSPEANKVREQVAKTFGKPGKDGSWVYNIPPEFAKDNRSEFVLSVDQSGVDPELLYGQLRHGPIGYFKPSDILSITIQ